MSGWRLLSRIPVNMHDWRMKVSWSPGRIGRLFGYEAKVLMFQGSGTVWHHYPTGRRASVRLEVLMVHLFTEDDMKIERLLEGKVAAKELRP